MWNGLSSPSQVCSLTEKLVWCVHKVFLSLEKVKGIWTKFAVRISFQFFVAPYNFHIAGLFLHIQLLYFSCCKYIPRYAFASDISLPASLMMNWIIFFFLLPQEWFFSARKYWLAKVSSPGACREAKARRDRVSSSGGADKVELVFPKLGKGGISSNFSLVCVGIMGKCVFGSSRRDHTTFRELCIELNGSAVKPNEKELLDYKICINLWISCICMLLETRRLVGFTEGMSMFWIVKMPTGTPGKSSVQRCC